MEERTARDAILRAARNLFTTKGFASTTVREICQEAGVTAPVLYYHFGNKEGLFDAVGQFNPTLAHGDSTEWFLRAAEHGAVMELLPDVLSYRRLHRNNRSRLRASMSRDHYLQILKASLDQRRRRNKAQDPSR